MRFFIFPVENIYIAVAADKVKRFISHDTDDSIREDYKDTVKQESVKDNIKIPVNIIFGKLRDNKSFRHGIVLKQETSDNKTLVIITPPVERDIDVAEKEIQSLPGSFSGVYSSFSGLYFNEQKIIFFLDIEKLTSLWLSKQECEFPEERQVSE